MHVTVVTEGEIDQNVVQFNLYVTPAETSLNLTTGLVWVEATQVYTCMISALNIVSSRPYCWTICNVLSPYLHFPFVHRIIMFRTYFIRVKLSCRPDSEIA